MDESEYKKVYQSVNTLRCIFEKANLTRRYDREKIIRINIAEREAGGCTDPEAQQLCLELLELFRKNAIFSLKMPHIHGTLPHAKEIKIQCGGLNGLQQALTSKTPEITDIEPGIVIINNIHGLIQAAIKNFLTLDKLPFQKIVKSITAYEGRKRKR